ncbi:MAG: ATP-binding cassette domain-containing protein [Sphingopyxis sp.]|nr:ATP-binding cassette domain-containing protein [Sphingopyxis sp.]
MSVKINALSLARGGRTMLTDVNAACSTGSITVIAGPNGAGKSTLLLALAGELAPLSGEALLDGSSLASLSPPDRAIRRAFLPQSSSVSFDFTVRDVVALGLHPAGLCATRGRGAELVGRAIIEFELGAMADGPVTRLSGGEQQRVHLGRTFTQSRVGTGRGLLLLDEPMNGLDYRHQFALAQLLREEAQRGVTIILTLHDLVMAERLADQILLLGEGRLLAAGPPSLVLRPQRIASAFSLKREEAAMLLHTTTVTAEAAE